MQDYAKQFYSSKAWKETRRAYTQFKGGLCERCLAKGIYRAGDLVHHKTHITPANINDPNITLSFDNLQLVCRDCHAAIHDKKKRRYKFDDMGRLIPR